MGILGSNEESNKRLEDINAGLQLLYENYYAKIGKLYFTNGNNESKMNEKIKEIGKNVFSEKNIKEILPEKDVMDIAFDFLDHIEKSERQLYDFAEKMLYELKTKDYVIYKEIHGKCPKCSKETMRLLPSSKKYFEKRNSNNDFIFDFMIQRNPGLFNIYCEYGCNTKTEPVKTRDFFILKGTYMDVDEFSARVKSDSRLVKKMMVCCFKNLIGQKKNVLDIYSARAVGKNYQVCKEVIEIARKHHDKNYPFIVTDYFKKPAERIRKKSLENGSTEVYNYMYDSAIKVKTLRYEETGMEFEARTRDLNDKENDIDSHFHHKHYEQEQENRRNILLPYGVKNFENYIVKILHKAKMLKGYNPDLYSNGL